LEVPLVVKSKDSRIRARLLFRKMEELVTRTMKRKRRKKRMRRNLLLKESLKVALGRLQ